MENNSSHEQVSEVTGLSIEKVQELADAGLLDSDDHTEKKLKNMDKLTIAVWNEAQMEEKINIATNLIRMRALLLEQIGGFWHKCG